LPELGEIKSAGELGRSNTYRNTYKYIWHACVNCGKARWVTIVGGKPESDRCFSCGNRCKPPCADATKLKLSQALRGEKHYNWRGGRNKTKFGYIDVKLFPGDFFYSMSDPHSYVKEHRLVMAKSLGRCLHDWEIVHHINGIKDDNRIENLQLVQEMQHNQVTKVESKIQRLEDRIIQLEAENVLLKSQLVNHSAF
jgi:hypothetical protein